MSEMNNNQQDKIISADVFDPTKDYKYIKPKVNKSGGKSVGILNSESNKALYLSTPLMLTWGVSEFVDDQSGKKSYNMSLQFPKEEYANEETTAFLNAMTKFQEKTIYALLHIFLAVYFKEFEKETKHLNFIFSSGNDFIYEFFNYDNFYIKPFSKKIFNYLKNNKLFNKLAVQYANKGLMI